jgi:hypothetical protein
MAELPRQSNGRPAVERGDVFVDQRSGVEREVERVVTSMGGRELRRPIADCIGRRHSTIRIDRLLDRKLYVRIFPTWKAVADRETQHG